MPQVTRPQFTKLRSGEWTVKSPGELREGSTVEVYTRNNWTKQKVMLLNKIAGPLSDGTYIYAIVSYRALAWIGIDPATTQLTPEQIERLKKTDEMQS